MRGVVCARERDHFVYPVTYQPDWIMMAAVFPKDFMYVPNPIPAQRSSANMRRPGVLEEFPRENNPCLPSGVCVCVVLFIILLTLAGKQAPKPLL